MDIYEADSLGRKELRRRFGIRMKHYQEMAKKTAIYQQKIWYPVIGLGGEVGELLNKCKKVLRDASGYFEPDAVEAIKLEMGDILWYLSMLATDLGIDMEDVATANIQKLQQRLTEGTISGSGDQR